MRFKNVLATTPYIKHLAESANFKVGTFNLNYNDLIVWSFEIPNVSYTQPPLGTSLENGNCKEFSNNIRSNNCRMDNL